jgi:transcriptional regulator CtsR
MFITKATYGGADCIEVIKSKIKDNRLIIRSLNDLIGDTQVGVVKYLEITGELDGEVFTERVREGDILTLPKSSNKRLGIFYSNNNNRGLWPAVYKSLDTIKVASEGKADIVTCMWNEMPDNPFHQLNIYYLVLINRCCILILSNHRYSKVDFINCVSSAI